MWTAKDTQQNQQRGLEENNKQMGTTMQKSIGKLEYGRRDMPARLKNSWKSTCKPFTIMPNRKEMQRETAILHRELHPKQRNQSTRISENKHTVERKTNTSPIKDNLTKVKM